MSEPNQLEGTMPGSEMILGEGIWENFTVMDGLPDMKVESIEEDSRGIIWIGTHDGGVARFDGRSFTSYNRSHGLSGDGVYSILEDGEGDLWFGTNRGLTRYDGQRFQVVDMDETFGLLWGSCADSAGRLWFGLERKPGRPAAVCCWDRGRARVVPVREEALPYGESIHSVAVGSVSGEEALWLGGETLYKCEKGLGGELKCREYPPQNTMRHIRGLHFDGNSLCVGDVRGVWRVLDVGASLVAETGPPGVCGVTPGQTGDIWAYTSNGEIVRIRAEEYDQTKVVGSPVQAGVIDRAGRMWLGTYGRGVLMCDLSTWLLYRDQANPDGGSRCVTKGGNGKIYFGMASGLWTPNGDDATKVRFEGVWEEITALVSDGYGAWVGGRRGSILRVRDARYEAEKAKGTEPYRISSLCFDEQNGVLWYSIAPGRGVGRVFTDGTPDHSRPGNQECLPAWIGAMVMSEGGHVLIGTARGDGDDRVYEIDKAGTPCRVTEVGPSITSLVQIEGQTYIGTPSGLFVLGSPRAEKVWVSGHLPCRVVTCLHKDSSEVLWIGTEGGGFCRFDGENIVVRQIPGGTAVNTIRGIASEGNGVVWLATDGGVIRYSPRRWRPSLALTLSAEHEAVPDAMGFKTSETMQLTLHTADRTRAACPFVRFRVRGLFDGWRLAQGGVVDLGRLQAGEYLAEAIATDLDFNHTDLCSLAFRVEPDNRDEIIRQTLRARDDCQFLGGSPEMASVLLQLSAFATTDIPILLLGETGTGKNVAARVLHQMSERRDGPFVQVNCGTITETLAEAEFFGHARGAFTGALERRIGRLQLANGGTVFLDEIGDLPPSVQAKLLSVLQDRRIQPVGDAMSYAIDVRVVSATNRDLESEVQEGYFRADLLYRLDGFNVRLPPLRERPRDIEVLARHFVSAFARHLNRPCPGLDTGALIAMEGYSWPGNVRELEHMMQRAVVLAKGNLITAADLPMTMKKGGTGRASAQFPALADHERAYISQVLDHTKGLIQGPGGAAEILKMNPSTLRSRMKKLGLRAQRGTRVVVAKYHDENEMHAAASKEDVT